MKARKEELEEMPVRDLLAKAKALEIKGRHKMTKPSLIESILSASAEEERLSYILKAKTGDIVAFRKRNGKVVSGMIKSIFTDRFNVQTVNGRVFIVSYADILWVKTNERWPKWVFDALKGDNNVRDCRSEKISD